MYGNIKKLDKPLEGCTIKDTEINVTKFYVVSRSHNQLPFEIDDANRNEKIENEGAIVSLKTRLDNRVMDLRTPAT